MPLRQVLGERSARPVPELPGVPPRPLPVFLVADAPVSVYPLALGLLQARARAVPSLRRGLRFMPFLNVPPHQAAAIGKAFGPGVWLFSGYAWSIRRTLEISRAVKALDPRNLTVHGGPSIPAYPEACQAFLAREPHVDVTVRGEGELACTEILERLLEPGDWRARLSEIAGLTLNGPEGPLRTPDRPRIGDLDDLPSPYLEGLFDSFGRLTGLLETNRGCPYSCAFCDWGSLTGQKIKLFGLDRVKEEIEWMARRRVGALYLTDANFGIFERDLEIAERLARARRDHGYPQLATITFAKHSTDRIVEIVRLLRDAGVTVEPTLSLQTTDPSTLEAVGRRNIRTDRYEDLLQRFRREEIPFVSELMVNLPGQTPAAFRRDLQAFLDRDVPVMIWPAVVLPNSPMASPEYLERHRIEADEAGLIQACSTFTRPEREGMMRLRSIYFTAEAFGYLRYLLRYLQWDHGIPAVEFLDALQEALQEQPEAFPPFARSMAFLDDPDPKVYLAESYTFRRGSRGRLGELYGAVNRFCTGRFGVPAGSPLEAVLRANRAVMPDPEARYPLEVALEHDVAAWFHDRRRGGDRPLADYGPGSLAVTDPQGLSREPRLGQPSKMAVREQAWELPSDLAVPWRTFAAAEACPAGVGSRET